MRKMRGKRSASSIVGCAPRCAEPHAETPRGVLTATIQRRRTVTKSITSFVCFRQGCVTRLVTARIELGGWVGAGVAMCKGYLVIPGHPVGGVRCDNSSVAL